MWESTTYSKTILQPPPLGLTWKLKKNNNNEDSFNNRHTEAVKQIKYITRLKKTLNKWLNQETFCN